MIYTLTLNPSLDYIMHTDLVLNALNRSDNEQIYPGGKGINVSLVLSRLGCKNVAIAPVAGKTGEMLESLLQGIETDFVYLKNGQTRINVKVLGKTETEINGSGVRVCFNDLKNKLEKITPQDILIICGSMAEYALLDEIVAFVHTDKLILDLPELEFAIKHRPFLIKPNLAELEQYFKCKIYKNSVEKYCKELVQKGCENVLLSMGKDGAYFCNDKMQFFVRAVDAKTVNTIGAGDSMVAGVIYGIENGLDWNAAVRMGVACGCATAFSDWIAQREEIMEIYALL